MPCTKDHASTGLASRYCFDSTNADLDVQIRAARRTAGIEEDSYYPFELYWEIDDQAIQQKFLSTVSELLGPGSIDAMIDHIDYILKNIIFKIVSI